MSKHVPPLTQKSESFVFSALIALSVFWLIDTVNDTVVTRISCDCDMGLFQLTEAGIHFLMLIAQMLLIVYLRRLFRERRKLEEGLRECMAKAEEEKARSAAILAAIGDLVTIQDTGYRIIFQNQASKDLMGDHAGEQCYRAYEQQEKVCGGCPLERTFAEGTVNTAVRKVTAGGAAVFLEVNAAPIHDASGRIVAGIEVCRDITARTRTEEEIRRLNAQLEQRAADLAAKNRELKAFSYSLSHDLNTPLTKIYCAVQTLEDEYAGRLDDTGRFLIRTIAEGSERMEELIEAMLVLAGVARRELRREEVDLGAMASGLIAELRQAEPHRRVDAVMAPDLTASGDPALLRTLLQNLLGNAWKYTCQVPAALIEVGAVERDGTKTFFVRDNGAGFDMKDAGKLFKPFERLHPTGEFPGTGIGLATVQWIIERHGGTITAQGEPGRGATFTFTLP